MFVRGRKGVKIRTQQGLEIRGKTLVLKKIKRGGDEYSTTKTRDYHCISDYLIAFTIKVKR